MAILKVKRIGATKSWQASAHFDDGTYLVLGIVTAKDKSMAEKKAMKTFGGN